MKLLVRLFRRLHLPSGIEMRPNVSQMPRIEWDLFHSDSKAKVDVVVPKDCQNVAGVEIGEK